MAEEVTDPALLAQLEQPVTDPALLAQLEGPGRFSRLMTGAKAGLADTAAGVGGLIENVQQKMVGPAGPLVKALQQKVVPTAVREALSPEARAEYNKAAEEAGGWGTAGRIGADVAATMIPGSKMVGAANKVPLVLRSALAGGALGAATKPGDAPERLEAGAWGMGGGALGEAVGQTGRRVLTGIIPSTKAAQRLMGRGIQPTIGQAADPEKFVGKLVSTIESAATSVPGIGTAIERARARTVKEGIEDIINKGLPPGATADQFRRMEPWEKIAAIKGTFGTTYDDALKGVKVRPTKEFDESVSKIVNDPGIGLTPAQREQVLKHVDDLVYQKYGNAKPTTGTIIVPGAPTPALPVEMAGDVFKRAESDIGAAARKWRGSATQQDRAVGEAYDKIKDAMRNLRKEGVAPEKRALVDAIDSQYAKFKRIEAAAGSAGASTRGGEFTPAQLMNAIRGMEANKGRFAAGRALGQGEAGDLASVTRGTLGESGTIPRLATALVMGGGAAALGLLPQLVSMGLVGAAGYTRPMQKLLLGGTKTQRGMDRALKAFLSKYRPGTAVGAAMGKQAGEENAPE